MNIHKMLLIACFLLSSCSENEQDLLNDIDKIKSKNYPFIDALAQWPKRASFKFSERVAKRPNPFKPAKLHTRSIVPHRKIKNTLEQFSLNQLQLVGVLKQENKIWALIQEPNQSIARVQVGDYLGTNSDQVVGIENDSIQIEEKITKTNLRKKRIMRLRLNRGITKKRHKKRNL